MTVDAGELRLTPQRRAVLEVLRDSTDHPTAAEVFDRVRPRHPGIGPATVYRALARLVETGAALELTLGDGGEGKVSRYDANVERHDHLVCTRCSRAVDIDSRLPGQVLADLADGSGFTIHSYDLQFHGLCPDCRAED